MNVLITGATGFVGREVIRYLLTKRPTWRLTAFALPDEPVPDGWAGSVSVRRGDVRDAKSVIEAVAGADLVFHLAAWISYWRLDYGRMRSVNVDGTSNIVNACLAAGVKRLVYVSSVGAIGFKSKGEPADESTPFNWPESLGYMTTKRDAQRLVIKATREHGLDAVIVNPASIMGPGDPNPGSAHNRLYADMYRRRVFIGTFTGGLAIVDVRDLVKVLVAAAEKGKGGEAYLAVGANVPYRRVLELMAHYAKRRFFPAPVPSWLLIAAGYIAELISVATKKRPLITVGYGLLSGWTAYYSNRKSSEQLDAVYRPLEDTIKDACVWYEAGFGS
jgi:dihydroflavonol-4-reductase